MGLAGSSWKNQVRMTVKPDALASSNAWDAIVRSCSPEDLSYEAPSTQEADEELLPPRGLELRNMHTYLMCSLAHLVAALALP